MHGVLGDGGPVGEGRVPVQEADVGADVGEAEVARLGGEDVVLAEGAVRDLRQVGDAPGN